MHFCSILHVWVRFESNGSLHPGQRWRARQRWGGFCRCICCSSKRFSQFQRFHSRVEATFQDFFYAKAQWYSSCDFLPVASCILDCTTLHYNCNSWLLRAAGSAVFSQQESHALLNGRSSARAQETLWVAHA